MNYSNYRISLDMHMSTSQALMRFNKNDNARKIVFVLTEDGKPYKLTSDCQAVFTAIKPDETRVMDACTINEDTGAIEYIIPVPDEEATPPVIPFTSAVGMFDAEIIVTGENDRVITTPRFTIEVRETVVSGIDLESVDQFNAFVSAYNGIREYTTRIQDLENVSENMSDIIEAFNDGDLKGEKGDKGDKGDTGDTGNDGVGIVSIFKSGTQDNVDTYTITLTNGSTYNFTVTNYDGSSITNLSNKIDSLEESKADVSDVNGIKALIPNQATSSNQLADKNFVNSSIGTNTSNYISDNGQPFSSLASLQAYSRTVTNNDYAFVTGIDDNGNTYFDRYKASVSGGSVSWAKEYRLNNSSFTANQWAAIESGLTSSDKTKLDGIEAGATQSKLVEVTYGVTTYDEITQMLAQGKVPYVKYSNAILTNVVLNNNAYYFFTFNGWLLNRGVYVTESDLWAVSWSSLEASTNKENTISPTSTTKYPSSKAVADYVAEKINGVFELDGNDLYITTY